MAPHSFVHFEAPKLKLLHKNSASNAGLRSAGRAAAGEGAGIRATSRF
jgi:hypothetical protein